jgi:hypothetical protein
VQIVAAEYQTIWGHTNAAIRCYHAAQTVGHADEHIAAESLSMLDDIVTRNIADLKDQTFYPYSYPEDQLVAQLHDHVEILPGGALQLPLGGHSAERSATPLAGLDEGEL